MQVKLLALLLCAASFTPSFGHTDSSLEANSFEVEGEMYAGKRGYLHMGLGVTSRLKEHQVLGLGGHVVREETDAEEVPSLSAFLSHEFDNGFVLTTHSFGYFPVE